MEENVSSVETMTEETNGQQEVSEETAESAPQGEANTEETTAQDAQPFLTIQYNKEDKGLSMEEAKELAQKGMNYDKVHARMEKFQKTYDVLDYLAAQSDLSVDDFTNGLMKSVDDAKRKEFTDRYGEDDPNIEKFMEMFHNERKEKYDKIISERATAEEKKQESRTAQIAEEFVQMQKDFPELKNIEQIPASVMKAANEGMPLAYAFLMNQHIETQKAAKAVETGKAAAESATGTLNDAPKETSDVMDGFMKGLWGK